MNKNLFVVILYFTGTFFRLMHDFTQASKITILTKTTYYFCNETFILCYLYKLTHIEESN